MGSSAQNSSGVHWCRSRVRFNGVPEKVPDKVWEALVQSQVRLNRIPEKVPEKVWESLVQSQVRLNRVSERRFPERRRFRRRSGRLWCRARSVSTGFRRRRSGAEACQVQQGFGVVQSHVRLGSGEGSGRVLVWPGSTRLQVGSGATPGVWSSKFRTKQL